MSSWVCPSGLNRVVQSTNPHRPASCWLLLPTCFRLRVFVVRPTDTHSQFSLCLCVCVRIFYECNPFLCEHVSARASLHICPVVASRAPAFALEAAAAAPAKAPQLAIVPSLHKRTHTDGRRICNYAVSECPGGWRLCVVSLCGVLCASMRSFVYVVSHIFGMVHWKLPWENASALYCVAIFSCLLLRCTCTLLFLHKIYTRAGRKKPADMLCWSHKAIKAILC